MPSRPRIILDCDPGHDDAIALLMAGQLCDVIGVTPVSGNVKLELTSHNALITTQLLKLDIPVHAGAARPLVVPPVHAEFIHGESGLGGPTLPPLERQLASHDGVRFIIDSARHYDNLWIVATGPLTNVALALRSAPDIQGRLQGIAIMGGSSSFGNVTPSAEFNIIADPEAAAIVFSSGVALRMCGLNLTHQWMISSEDIVNIRAIGNAAAVFTADMLEFYANMYANKFFGKVEGPLHDPCAVLSVTHPELFRFEARHVEVELHGQHTRGMTVVDERGVKSDAALNVEVAYQLDIAQAQALLLECIRSYS